MKYLILLLPLVACKPNNLPDPMTRLEFKFALDSLVSIYELRLAQAGEQPKIPAGYAGQDAERAKDEKAEVKHSGVLSGEVITDKKGNTYPIYVGVKGGKYILKTSAKTGKEYKAYIK